MIEVQPDNPLWTTIVKEIRGARNIVVLAGAGISTDAGLPDFYSRDGVYANGSPFTMAGFADLSGRRRFMSAALGMYRTAKESKPTRTHQFIRGLQDNGQLRRFYSQNMDGLEETAGFRTDPELNVDGLEDVISLRSDPKSPGFVPLHGTIRYLRCMVCGLTSTWEERKQFEQLVSMGEDLYCLKCETDVKHRVASGKRRRAVGLLRPAIVCSDEAHPSGEEIARFVAQDEAKADTVLIMGTSLTFDGPENIARRFAHAVHGKSRNVFYINATKPRRRISGFVDYWVNWKCDAWVDDLQQKLQHSQPIIRGPGKPGLRKHISPYRRRKKDEPGFKTAARHPGGITATRSNFTNVEARKKVLVQGDCPELPIVLE
ncbi:NAD-dependent deacetylase hst3 [Lecanicillium sp. MT-2017a]|nr:NAD-dependent deacetylase hst3 [Lecanicillium sp. MT-2017a]